MGSGAGNNKRIKSTTKNQPAFGRMYRDNFSNEDRVLLENFFVFTGENKWMEMKIANNFKTNRKQKPLNSYAKHYLGVEKAKYTDDETNYVLTELMHEVMNDYLFRHIEKANTNMIQKELDNLRKQYAELFSNFKIVKAQGSFNVPVLYLIDKRTNKYLAEERIWEEKAISGYQHSNKDLNLNAWSKIRDKANPLFLVYMMLSSCSANFFVAKTLRKKV